MSLTSFPAFLSSTSFTFASFRFFSSFSSLSRSFPSVQFGFFQLQLPLLFSSLVLFFSLSSSFSFSPSVGPFTRPPASQGYCPRRRPPLFRWRRTRSSSLSVACSNFSFCFSCFACSEKDGYLVSNQKDRKHAT
jgi:hypothetical protein